jgi:hypothetical protein
MIRRQVIRDVRTRNSNNRVSHVFQVNPPRNPITIKDASDLLEYSDKLTDNQKRDIFASCGADYDNVVKYYDEVVFIEKMWQFSQHRGFFDLIKELFGLKIE